MSNKTLVWMFVLWFVCNNAVHANQSGRDSLIWFNPHYEQPTRLLFDYYHHGLPKTKVGNYLTTGSWIDNEGRYGWNDFVHTNTFDHAYTILSDEFAIGVSRQPYTKELLKTTDGVVIIAADNPRLITDAITISDEEIEALRRFVYEGGSLMMMLNGVGEGRFSESFETEQVRKIANRFGLDWNNDDTHYSDIKLPQGHAYFYDVPNFHYGAGCTISILPNAVKPQVLLDVYSDAGYPDRSVEGPGIVMVRPGRGKFILVGDAGSWTGNLSRPWVENERLMRQLFRYMKPDRDVQPAAWEIEKPLLYEMTFAALQAVPLANTLSNVKRPKYRMFSPRPQTNMPYIEASATLKLIPQYQTSQLSAQIETHVLDFNWFDLNTQNSSNQNISFLVSRQGKVSGIETNGKHAQWLASDISLLSALLPYDGVSPGSTWESVESLRIPTLRGTDLPPIREELIRIRYVKDTEFDGKNCRLLEASGEIWLDQLDINVEDLLPEEEIKRVGLLPYGFFHERGGKLLFKREQWVDAETGVVLSARAQSRIIAWIEDQREPIPNNNADKDNEMIVSLASTITFKLKTKNYNLED